MKRWGWYAVAAAGSALTGVVAVRSWPGLETGPFDPVSAALGVASLVVTVWFAVRAQRQVDRDVTGAAKKLAIKVRHTESKMRGQLLGGDAPIDVQFVLRPAPTHDADGAAPRGALTGVAGYYQDLRPRRMVITGAAGSGKTVLAAELILELLPKPDRALDGPVPVRLSATALDIDRPVETAVEDWLSTHLRRYYGLSKVQAEVLATTRMALPVIDGLDELDASKQPGHDSHAAHVIRACNAYLDSARRGQVVITCRTKHYAALKKAKVWLQDAACVEICQVAPPQSRRFLAGRFINEARWQPVTDTLRHDGDGPLASALSTPWGLNLAAIVYEQRDPRTEAFVRDPAELGRVW